MNDNKKFWQRFAKLYSPFMERGNKQTYDKICVEAVPYLNKEMNVLELACGSGQLSFRLATKTNHWEATDFSENMIAEAKKKKPIPRGLYFSVQDAGKLPYVDKTFDAVMIANALHIMPEPDKAMAEICRVLKQDGILFAPTFVHGESAGYNLRMKLMNIIGFRTYSKWSAAEFKSYIENFEFDIEKVSFIESSLTPLCNVIARRRICNKEKP